MIIKIVFLFLAAMAVLAMFGRLRLRLPGAMRKRLGRTCPKCGRHRIGSGPCACGKGKG